MVCRCWRVSGALTVFGPAPTMIARPEGGIMDVCCRAAVALIEGLRCAFSLRIC